MDGAESDGSEDYFSAAEQPQTATAEPTEKQLAVESWGLQLPSGGEDGKIKTAQKKRRRERHNSETTTDSHLIIHALDGMNTLYVMWANEKLCDVTVVVGGDEFPAHGVVLATHSDYFLRLLLRKQSGAAAMTPDRFVLESPVSASGFRRILRYMYTAELDLEWATVCETVQVARALTVTRVAQLGQEFLQSYTAENCLGAMLATSRDNLTSLTARIRKFVLDNFLAVSQTKEFLQCPVETIADLLADDNLSVPSELDVLVGAKNWIHANGEEGLQGAPLVMRLIRFQQITLDELKKHIETDEKLMQIPEVRARVMAVHIQQSSIASTNNASLVGSMSKKAETNKDKVRAETIHLPGEKLQMQPQNVNVDDLKKAKTIDQSTPSSLPSTSTESQQRINHRNVTGSDRYLHITSSGTPIFPQSSDIEARIKEAKSVAQSALSSHDPTLTSLDSSQPISDRGAIKSSQQQTTAPETASPTRSKSLHIKADTSKKATAVQSSLATPQQATPRQSLRPISGSLHIEADTSKKATVIQSSSATPLRAMLRQSLQPISSKNLNGASSLAPSIVKTLASPRFHTTRHDSDYRLTASHPKALTGGPIAWPMTQLLARGQKHDVIITVGGVAKGGESEIAGRMVQAFLVDKNEWRDLERMPAARNHHVVHCLNGFLYVVGGSDPHTEGDDFLKPVSSVLKYDVRAGKWSEAHPMNAARIFHEVTALFGQLYVVGGQDQDGRTLATVECYSPNSDQWHYVASLPSARYGVAVTVYHGRLWVAGGYPEERLIDTSTVPTDVICYNPFRNEWYSMARLRVPRCHTSLLEMANRLYMIGGFVGDSNSSDEKSQSMSTIEVYDESNESWELVAGLWQGRHDANTVTLGDKAYIIGGMEDENEDPLPSVECFDPLTASWARGLAALPLARFGHACCVVPGDVPIKWSQSLKTPIK